MCLWPALWTSNNQILVREISQWRAGESLEVFKIISFSSSYGYINGSATLANCSIAERALRLQEAKVKKLSPDSSEPGHRRDSWLKNQFLPTESSEKVQAREPRRA